MLNAISFFHSFDIEPNFFTAAKDAEKKYINSRMLSHEAGKFGLDPFSLPISEHRHLRKLNENDYSDWLAWTLRVLCINSSNPYSLCDELFFDRKSSINTDDKNPLIITREYIVEKGHEESSGRLDLLIHSKSLSKYIHIEVKVFDAESADLKKNDGYADSLDEQFPDCVSHVLLVLDHQNVSYRHGKKDHEFKVVKWIDLSRRLRRIALNESSPSLIPGITLFFCSIIEQKLLGITKDSLMQFDYLSEIRNDNSNR